MRTPTLLALILLVPTVVVATSPPSAPLSPAASTGSVPGEIDLSWAAPASSGSTPVAGYRVYRSLNPAGLAHLIDLGNVLVFTDLGVPDGAPRYYRFSAVNADGEGPLSAVVSAQALAPPTAPIDPEGARSPAIGRGNLTLSWDPPQWDGGDPPSVYSVYRSPDAVSVPFSLIGTTSSLSYLDVGLGDNATYWYRVSATNVYGEGPASVATAVTTPGVPYPPSNFSVGSSLVFGVAIDWDRPEEGGLNITNYYLNRSIGSEPEKVLQLFRRDQEGYTDRDCPVTQICTYRITARNPVGFGNPTFTLSARGTKLPLVG